MNKTFTLSWMHEHVEKCIDFQFRFDGMNRIIETEISLFGTTGIIYKSRYHQCADEWFSSEEDQQNALMAIVVSELKEISQLPISEDIDPNISQVVDVLANALRAVGSDALPWVIPMELVDCENNGFWEEHDDEAMFSKENGLVTIDQMHICFANYAILDLSLYHSQEGHVLKGELSAPHPEIDIIDFSIMLGSDLTAAATPLGLDALLKSIENELAGQCVAKGFSQDISTIRKAVCYVPGFLHANVTVMDEMQNTAVTERVSPVVYRPLFSELDIAGQQGL